MYSFSPHCCSHRPFRDLSNRRIVRIRIVRRNRRAIDTSRRLQRVFGTRDGQFVCREDKSGSSRRSPFAPSRRERALFPMPFVVAKPNETSNRFSEENVPLRSFSHRGRLSLSLPPSFCPTADRSNCCQSRVICARRRRILPVTSNMLRVNFRIDNELCEPLRPSPHETTLPRRQSH